MHENYGNDYSKYKSITNALVIYLSSNSKSANAAADITKAVKTTRTLVNMIAKLEENEAKLSTHIKRLEKKADYLESHLHKPLPCYLFPI